MAEQKGLRIGDILNTESNSMNSDGTNNWSFEIVGFYTAKQIKGDEMGAVINWDSFDETRVNQKGTVGMIMVKASSAEMGDSISNQIDQRFMNSSYATRSGPESMIAVEMAGEFADVELIVNSILLSVFFTILLVSSNTLAQSIRERTSDIGVLKCLGYKDLTIFTSVIFEAITICFIAVFSWAFSYINACPGYRVNERRVAGRYNFSNAKYYHWRFFNRANYCFYVSCSASLSSFTIESS